MSHWFNHTKVQPWINAYQTFRVAILIFVSVLHSYKTQKTGLSVKSMLNESLAICWVSVENILKSEGYRNLGYWHTSWLTDLCLSWEQYWQYHQSGLVLLWWTLWCFLLGGWLLSTRSGHLIFIATAWVNSWGLYKGITMYTFLSSKQTHWQNSV